MNYLYNGIELPALQNLPYGHAYIKTSETFGYTLTSISAPYVAVGDNLYILPVEKYPTYSHEHYYAKDGVWTLMRRGTEIENSGLDGNGISGLSSVLWANTDIADENGAVIFAASVPVPVTETDHNALTQGWIVGKRLAAQRGKA
jgi:hypothetical protein